LSANVILRPPRRRKRSFLNSFPRSSKEVKETPELPNRTQVKKANPVNSSGTSSDDEHSMTPFLVAAANGHWKVLKKLIEFLDKNYDAYDDTGVLQNPFAMRTRGSEENVLHLILNRPDSILIDSENPSKLNIQVRPVLTMFPGNTRSRSYKAN
jgi:hypothetical protein